MTTQIENGYKLENGSLYEDQGTQYMHVCSVPPHITDINEAIEHYNSQW